MEWIRQRVLQGEVMFGIWLSLGSSFVAEIAGLTGFEWALIDNEHGLGDYSAMAHQIQALSNTSAAPIVRVPANQPEYFKRALDLGASGIMVPQVNNAKQAEDVVQFMRYAPAGIRGLTRSSRASKYGMEFDEYFEKVNDNLLTIVQIETKQAVENAGEIAAVEGVDVLFVGPSDLCLNLGIPWETDHKEFKACTEKVVNACSQANKKAGILLKTPVQAEEFLSHGFTCIAVGVDLGIIRDGMKKIADELRKIK